MGVFRACLYQRVGDAWLSEKTGKTRKVDPVEAKVSENLMRARTKAEQRLAAHCAPGACQPSARPTTVSGDPRCAPMGSDRVECL